MVRTRNHGRRVADQLACRLLCGVALGLVGGCAHQDPVDTPLNWWHQLEGGAIAQQRPPPPGVDDPYPKIGTTPAAAPQVASMDLRKSVTAGLVEQRNLSARLNAHDPLPPPVAVATPGKAASGAAPGPAPAGGVPGAPAAAAAANPALSSATLDAAEAPPPPATPVTATGPASGATKGGKSGHGRTDVLADPSQADEPELAMPDLAPPPATGPGSVTAEADANAPTPQIPGAPPPPPSLPGMGLAPLPPVAYAAPARPTYQLATVPGEALVFAAGTDVLSPGQGATLRSVATRRGAGSVYVHGFGDAASDAPHDQAQALTLAALRARAVADALEKDGVPASAIRMRADAFGRGAVAGLVE
ncbi:OmpA family protein [Lichenicola sp.]|uniref:OmpA family protein n=1 Tax=Lichenicola sp. TaxID=2804529 RepID=UPI003AFFC120